MIMLPNPMMDTLELTDDTGQLKVYNGKEREPVTWFWNTLFIVLGFVTHYFRIWAGDFVL